MKIRRVVTGHDEAGKAVFVDDREVEPITVALSPGAEYHRLWGGNDAPSFPDDGSPPPLIRVWAADRVPAADLSRVRYSVGRRYSDRQAASIRSRATFMAAPPPYWPGLPSLRTTRWHGTTIGTGLWEQALAAARTAAGRPAPAAASA